ncbi:MAG: YeeE/YedE family protein [Chloroflexi bacterium]|nr:YeeE/YedE family protein [Chloroflexota bacterium]
MAPFPLPLESLVGVWGAYLVYLVIGFGFGYALEISGFGHSPKLAAQFYFKDLTVLKVMFTAIVVAMVLIFLASGLGLLDYNLVWVNPTYLWPGIVGGLIMGVGFIVGGFCPGTSVVAAATAKLDGILFLLGVFFGIFVFGETVSFYEPFFNSSYFGRLTIMDWLNAPTGWVVLGVTLMALFMFWGGEHLERIFGKRDLKVEPRARRYGALALVGVAVAVLVIGQPTNADKWAKVAATRQAQLDNREVQVHPGEVLELQADRRLVVRLIDVRTEADYNLFHLEDAVNVPLAALPENVDEYLLQPGNTVFILMSNDEAAATQAWKYLVAENVPNVYILEGGVNYWLSLFAEETAPYDAALFTHGDDSLRQAFSAALGARHPAARPSPHGYAFEFTKKVKLELKRGPSGGGCG